MSIAMTPQQRAAFDKQGFIILEDFLTPVELNSLSSAADEVADRARQHEGLGPDDPVAVRNALSHHQAFLDLIDHPRMLPLVVDAIGWNIQIRTTHLDCRPPYPHGLEPGTLGVGDGADNDKGYRNLSWHPDLASDTLFMAPSLDGRLPFMELKVFYVFSDLSEPQSGNLWLSPGSHLRSPRELTAMGRQVDPDDALELRLRPGAAVLWRTAVWHCVGPNLSRRTRKIMHVGYHYRWLRPTDYITQDQALIDRSSPIRKQLLGALPSGGHPLGSTPDIHPSSQYWLTKNQDDVPLRAWAESQMEKRQVELA